VNINSFRNFTKYKNKRLIHLKKKQMSDKIEFTPDVLQIAKVAKALSHPVRVHILKKLSIMNACCYSGDLVEELPVGRSTLSQHLKELKYAGLIQGEINPPYIKYCINRETWEETKILFVDFLNETQPIMLHSVKESNPHNPA
jgi:DNA-binding transcriptional ArsR family regulator